MAVIKLSEAKVNFIKGVCKSYGNKPGEVINVLHKVQGEYGYLPAEVQELDKEGQCQRVLHPQLHSSHMLAK